MAKSFHILWISYLVSQIGDWLYLISVPLIIYNLTGSAFQMASIYGVEFIPWILFSIIGGLLADLLNKKRLLVISNIISGILVAVLSVFVSVPKPNMMLVYIGVFCLASINPLTHPSFNSIIPALVKKTELVKANSIIQLIENSISFIGPMVGGSIFAIIGGKQALNIDAASFVIAAFFIFFISYKHVSSQNTVSKKKLIKNLKVQLSDGFKYSMSERVIFFGSLLFLCTNFAINILQGNFMYYMAHILHFSPAIIGLTIGLQGIGPIVGSFIAPFISQRISSGKLICLATSIAGFSTFFLLFARTFWSFALVQGIVLACGNINVITYFSLRQRVVPAELLGRVVSVTRMISYASIPIGAFLGGAVLSQGIPMFTLFIIAGSIRLMVGLGGFYTPLGKANKHNYDVESQLVVAD